VPAKLQVLTVSKTIREREALELPVLKLIHKWNGEIPLPGKVNAPSAIISREKKGENHGD
jgi:hypothetical protein